MLRTAGLVMQDGGGMAAICPRCKANVPFTPDLAKALQTRLALLFKAPAGG